MYSIDMKNLKVKTVMKRILMPIAFIAVFAFVFSFVPAHVLAQTGDLGAISDQTGLTTESPLLIVARVIRVILSLLGILLVCLIIYAGVLWMTAGGNVERVQKAKRILINAVIGLFIILASVAITTFIMSALSRATGSNVGSGSGSGGGGGGLGGGGGASSFTVARATEGDYAIYNILPQVQFSRNYDPDTIQDSIQLFNADTSEEVAINIQRSNPYYADSPNSDNVLYLVPDTTCPAPNDDIFCLEQNTNYRLTVLEDQIKSSTGLDLTCSSLFAPCEFDFSTGDILDLTSPTAQFELPDAGARVSANVLESIQVTGTDDSGITSASVEAAGSAVTGVVISQIDDENYLIETNEWDTGSEENVTVILSSTVTDAAGNVGTARRSVRVSPAHCFNGLLDAADGETGIDCGGDCGSCTGNVCTENSECSSGLCLDGICAAPPRLTAMNPEGGGIGTYVLLSGERLSNSGSVYFSGSDGLVEALRPACAAGIEGFGILAEVPEGAVDGPIIFESPSGLSDATNDDYGPIVGSGGNFDVNDVRRPNLCNASPYTGSAGTTVTLTGTEFASGNQVDLQGVGRVDFERLRGQCSDGSGQCFLDSDCAGDAVCQDKDLSGVVYTSTPAENYESWTDVLVRFFLDGSLPDSDYFVRVTQGGQSSNPLPFFVRTSTDDGGSLETSPQITSISHDSGAIGDYLTIRGTGFGNSGQVFFDSSSTGGQAIGDDDFPAQCSADAIWTNTQVIIRIPDEYANLDDNDGVLFETHDLYLQRSSDSAFSNSVNFTIRDQAARPGLCAIDPGTAEIGDEVALIGGNLPTGDSGAKVVFTPELSVTGAAVTWANDSRTVTNIPEGANSGQVVIETAEGVRSNPVDLTIGSTGGPDLVETDVSHYGFTFTTGVIPPKPSLIVACDAENDIYSALPNSQFNAEVCTNVEVEAEFDVAMDSASLIAGVTFHECNNERCTNISDPIPSIIDTSVSGFRINVDPVAAAGAGFFGYSSGGGITALKADTEYLVQISGEVESVDGEPLGEDISWRFRTGAATNICDVEEIVIKPASKTFESLGESEEFEVRPIGMECVPLSDELDYSWQHPAGITSRRTCDSADSDCIRLNSVAEGEGNLRASIDSGLSDTSLIEVELEDYYVERIYPDCGSACRNADVRVVFSRPVDDECSSASCVGLNGVNGSDNLLAGMELRWCQNDDCSESLLIDTEKECKIEGENGGCKEYSLQFDGLLEADAEYRVLIYNDVFSVDGQYLTRLNDGIRYSHAFSTTDKICAPAAISVRPASATAKSTEDYQAYLADARSNPDTCSDVGQLLNAKNLNWEWGAIPEETVQGNSIKLADYYRYEGALFDAGMDALCASNLVAGGLISECEDYAPTDNVGPLQILEITNDAPKLVDPQTRLAEVVFATTAAEAIQDVEGSAKYRLQCSAEVAADCPDPATQGVGENGCCSLRPNLVGSDPANSQINVCRNKLFELEFNTEMDAGSIQDGVSIIFGEGLDECPATHELVSADTGRPVGIFARIFRSFIPSVFAQEATECRLPIERVAQAVSADGHGHVRLFTNELLATGAEYEIRIDDTVRSSLGVAANAGQVIFTAGSEICLVDEVEVSDPEAQVEGFFNAANQTRPFQATAISYSEDLPQSIQPIAGVYSWDWQDWEETGVDSETAEDADLVTLSNEAADGDESDADVTSGIQSGEGYVFSSLVIDDETGIDEDGRRLYGNLPITTFFCEAPWPSIEAFPFVDGIAYGQGDATDLTGAIEGGAWTHFSTMYCKDNGLEQNVVNPETGRQETVQIDLPGLNLALASDSPKGIGVLKEYLFNVQGTQDLIAVRVLSNSNYLSPLEWYAAQGFEGSPDVTTVDGFPALREGRSVYVFAPNQEALDLSGTAEADFNNLDQYIYPNVYIISYNQSADQSTRAIWNQMVRNFKLAVNVKDERVCTNTREDGSFISCSSDIDCGSAGICQSDKLKLQRDAQRIFDTIQISRQAENAGAPRLNAGTFVAGMTTSAWPSWNTTFAGEVGGVPVDPVNKFASCPEGADPATCFNEESRQFVCTEDDLIYRYKIAPLGDFEVSARLEYPASSWGAVLPGDVVEHVKLQGISNFVTEYIEASGFSVGFTVSPSVCTGAVIGDSAVCGDGIVGGEEVCEPGLPSGFEACTATGGVNGRRALGCASDCSATISVESNACVAEACGNGILDPGEICDDGANNGQYGFCGTQCNYEPGAGGAAFCGDGILNVGEACDCGAPGLGSAGDGVDLAGNECVVKNGQYSSNRSQTCSWDCRGPAAGFCGNGAVETTAGEQCDGVQTRDAGTGRVCVAGDPQRVGQLCSSNASCNTAVEEGLQVNDGICSTEEVPLVERRACFAPGVRNTSGDLIACQFDGGWSAPQAANECGNGQLEEGEECDDGNTNTNDSCTNICTLNVCGDGIVNIGIEGCDAGAQNGQACSAPYGGTCSYCSQTCNTQVISGAYCGDGQLQQTLEICDPSSDQGIYQWVTGGGTIVNGYCSPSEHNLTKEAFYTGIATNGQQYSGTYTFYCSAIGICEGGTNDGKTCSYASNDQFNRSCGGGGTCVQPTCNQSCSLACPFEYSDSLVQFRANLEGSQRSGSITLSNLSNDTNFSDIGSPRRAEVYIPACTASSGLVGDITFNVDATPKVLVNVVVDLSGSMGLSLGDKSRIEVMIDNLKSGTEQLFDELGENLELRFTFYGSFTDSGIFQDEIVTDHGFLAPLPAGNTALENEIYENYVFSRTGGLYAEAYTRKITSEDSLTDINNFLDDVKTAYDTYETALTYSAEGLGLASKVLYDDFQDLTENEQEIAKQILIFTTDGQFEYNNNPSLAACRANALGQEVFTLAMLDQSDSSMPAYLDAEGTTPLITGATCEELFNLQSQYLAGNYDRFEFETTTAPSTSQPAQFCEWAFLANIKISESEATNHLACMSSGNPDPDSLVDYARVGRNEAAFTDAFDDIVNAISGAVVIYPGSSETIPIEAGANVSIPLPEDFVCSDDEQVVPIGINYSGEGSITISNVRFSYCPY